MTDRAARQEHPARALLSRAGRRNKSDAATNGTIRSARLTAEALPPLAGAQPAAFGRYRVLGLLGAGANGLVYSVEDPEVGVPVALKVLRPGAGHAAELKREFRLVADLAHPNLVLPYALEADGETVFFTMELVRGSTIIGWLSQFQEAEAERGIRIRTTFCQLAEGLLALHERGLLHRDVKPSNVLVADDGRVAILDFGLLSQAQAAPEGRTPYLAGTPAYLAPELLRGGPATRATDAYAVGVLLHQALTGRWPFAADLQQSVVARLREQAPAVAAVPEDLASLCAGLLHNDPAQRLPLEGLLAARPSGAPPHSVTGRTQLVLEREEEMAALLRAQSRVVAQGKAEVVRLPGRSGMGKSALLRLFAQRASATAWVLEGRAYERDSVPFKALDGAMDQLARRISALSESDRKSLLPSDPHFLHALFPALGTALQIEPSPPTELGDATTRRRHAIRVLRELFAKVSERFGLVVTLDDLHWGDLDSARLLPDLLAQPAAPMLLVLSYREEEADAPFLTLYHQWERDHGRSEVVPVNALAPDAALRVAEALSGGRFDATEIARQSAGCPFMIEMLVSTPDRELELDLDLERAFSLRLASMPAAARRMLEAVCLAARPVARTQVPFTPAGVPEARALWASLVSDRWLRSNARDEVEAYHDRIRASVTSRLEGEARVAIHRALGEAFATAADAEGAAAHLAASGEHARALAFARTAAHSALAALAFDRAAQLLGLALECCPASDQVTRNELVLGRARALANGGRGAEAAPLFLQRAERADGLEADNLRREAMEQYLIAGRLDEGRPVMERLLTSLKVWHPRAAWLTNAALYGEVLRLVIRGPKVRPQRALVARERLLLDSFVSMGKGLASYDATLGAWCFLRAARLALDWGDARTATRGIAYTATLLGFSGSDGDVKRANEWAAAGEGLAQEHADGHGLAFCQVARGMIRCCSGDWKGALRTFDEAARVLDERYAASDWEADTAKNTSLFALTQLGDIGELELRANALTREARERGDLALEVESNLYLALAALARDSLSDARSCVSRNAGLWTIAGYHFQHWIVLRFRVLALLYEGAFEEALEAIEVDLPRARRANLTAMQVVRIEAHDLRGRAALGAAVSAGPQRRKRLLDQVGKDIELLRRERKAHALAPSEMLCAGSKLLLGARDAAGAHVERARAAYEEADMRTHSLTADWHLAALRKRPDLTLRSESGLKERGVMNATAWARMHLGVHAT